MSRLAHLQEVTLIQRLMAHPLLRTLVGTSALAGLIKITGSALGFLFFAGFARLLSPEEYGIFAVGFSSALILSTLAGVGQAFAILRFWPTVDERCGPQVARHTLTRGAHLVGLACLGLIVVACGVAATGVSLPNLGLQGWSIVAIGALACAMALAEYAASGLRAQGAVLRALLPRDIFWRVNVLAVAFGLGMTSGVGTLWLTAGVLGGLVAMQVMHFLKQWRVLVAQGDAPLPSEVSLQMRKATAGLWGIAIANAIGQNAATIVIGFVLGPVMAAGFFAAARLSELMAMFLLAINQVFGPLLSRSWHAGRSDEVRLLYFSATVISFGGALAVFVAFVLFGDWFLSLFGVSYTAAYPLLIILSLGQLINTACGPNRAFLMMVGQERPLFWLVAGTSLMLPLALPVAAGYGAAGAAVVVSAAMVVLNLGAVAVLATVGFRSPPRRNPGLPGIE